MVSDEPLWCWWLLMVVNSSQWLNLQKNMCYIQTAWALKAKMLTWHKHTSENHSLFSSNIGIRKKSYAHFPHKHQHFCRGWTEVSSNLLEETLLPLSVFKIQQLYLFPSNVIRQHKCRKCQIFLAFSCQRLDETPTCLLSLFTLTSVLLWGHHVPQVDPDS